MNHGDLMDAFGVSVNQAPDNMVYDKSARTNIRATQFEPLFLKPDASRYLSQLHSVADGILDRDDAWTGQLPSNNAAPTPVRDVNAKTKHQSLFRPESRWRWIAPHAIGFDGFRCHTRAFCLTDKSFKNFLLFRIIETRGTQPSEVGPDADTDWNEQVTLEIGPHPELSDTQQKVITLGYGMGKGKAKIPVRRALLYCALKRLGLDIDRAGRHPQDQQILLIDKQRKHSGRFASKAKGLT